MQSDQYQSTKLEFDFQCHGTCNLFVIGVTKMVGPVSALATLCGYKPITG